MKIEKENIIKGLTKKDNIKLSSLLDKYYLHQKTNKTTNSNFLDLYDLKLWENRIKKYNLNYSVYQENADCEKYLIYFGELENFITIYKGTCFKNITHRDVLGSLFAIGLDNSTIGDIFVDNNVFYLTNLTKMNSFLEQNLLKIGNQSVKLEVVSKINHSLAKYQLLNILVSSLRLDNIVCKLANLSRNQANFSISNHQVLVNSQETLKSDYLIKTDDIISIRQIGKFRIGEILSVTKKNKIVLEIKKYN